MDKTAAKRQRTRRAKLTRDGMRLVRIPLGRDTLAALDRLKASHGTRQAAIEHAIRFTVLQSPELLATPNMPYTMVANYNTSGTHRPNYEHFITFKDK